jgi:hypothetical protein
MKTFEACDQAKALFKKLQNENHDYFSVQYFKE